MVKRTQTIRRLLPKNCLSVLDDYVGLALKVLTEPKQVSKRLCAAGHDCSGSKDIQWFK